MTAADIFADLLHNLVPNASPWLETTVGLVLLLTASALVNLIVKKVILRIITQLLLSDSPIMATIAARLANIFPALIISGGIGMVPHLPDIIPVVTRNVVGAFVILTITLALNGVLNLVNELYQRRPDAASRPIKGYVQLMKIALFVGATILMIAVLMEQSPLYLLSGLGAMAAVVMLVFKDTILSLVASVQLTSNDMVRVGDWIAIPALNIDGNVIDIALHTVKVQNWDKTISTVPTQKLISDSFQNWRGMSEAGGRRIKRALLLDQNSIRFLTPEERESMHRFAALDTYLERKRAELEEWNAKLVDAGKAEVNTRRITNIGTFRAYVYAYLQDRPDIRKDMTLLVRQLQPTAQGLPLEIYCFTKTTSWNEYEGIQSDIFDHLIALLPEFGLRLYQQPSGLDLEHLKIS